METTLYIAYIIGVSGTWILADGVASLWTYLPKAEETFWRNHALRIFRSVLGLLLIVLGGLLL